MTGKDAFTDEEWTRLTRAPFVAGMAISLADPGGPIEAFKETSATLKAVLAAEHGGSEVAEAIAASTRAREHKNPLQGFKPTSAASAGVEILDELKAAHGIVAAKGTPEEADAFANWLLAVAQAAADAAKEGGFMGFHAERVSAGEQRMLDSIREALGA
jgi:hypothetical protein